MNLTPGDIVALSAFVRYRNDDFDSNVTPSQPLLGTGLPEQAATSPGDQLGLLKDTRVRYGADVFAQPNPRVMFKAFVNYDTGASLQRSLEFNENNKQNPSAVATAELGPWTRASSQWTADTDDRTWSGGLGTTLQLMPERLDLIVDYTLSLAEVDIAYSGFGVTNFNGAPFPPNHQFAFSSPPTVREDLHVVNCRFEIPVKTMVLIAGYTYEQYTFEDWRQGSSALGAYLAPSYHAHIGFVGLRYRF